MRFTKVMCVAALAGVLMPAGAWAGEDSGFHAGAGIGYARQKSPEFEGNDTAFKLFGGWSLNPYFGLEGGYIDAGTQSDRPNGVDIDISSDGFFVQGIARWPLGRYFAPYAKFGYVFYDVTTRLAVGSQSISETESDSDFIYGGGLEFRLGERFSLRAEYEEVNLPDSAFDMFSLAGTWRF